jgi:hypothetical protein
LSATNVATSAAKWESLLREVMAAINSVDTRYGTNLLEAQQPIFMLLPQSAYNDYLICATAAKVLTNIEGHGTAMSDRTFNQYQQMWFTASGVTFLALPDSWFYTISNTHFRAFILTRGSLKVSLPNMMRLNSFSDYLDLGGMNPTETIAALAMDSGFSLEEIKELTMRFGDPMITAISRKNGTTYSNGHYSMSSFATLISRAPHSTSGTTSLKTYFELNRNYAVLREAPTMIQEFRIPVALLSVPPVIDNPQPTSLEHAELLAGRTIEAEQYFAQEKAKAKKNPRYLNPHGTGEASLDAFRPVVHVTRSEYDVMTGYGSPAEARALNTKRAIAEKHGYNLSNKEMASAGVQDAYGQEIHREDIRIIRFNSKPATTNHVVPSFSSPVEVSTPDMEVTTASETDKK